MLLERKELIEDMINNHPLLLLTLKDKEEISFVNALFPFSIGIEIECNYKDNLFNVASFEAIPNIMDVQCDSGEQRFRIPAGIKGLLVLHHVSEGLKKFSELNPLSGIHYHVGVENNYHSLSSEQAIKENKEWILEELDTWNYKGDFNHREMGGGHCWVRTSQSSFKTIEFRLGEMTFDYELLVERIIHLTNIIKKYITNTGGLIPIVEDGIINSQKVLEFEHFFKEADRKTLFNLYKELKDIDKEEEEVTPTKEEMKRIINNRIIKS